MKKTFLYSLAVLASVTLASCNGDYDDWANPQTNPQEASAAKYGITFAAGTEAESSLPDDDGIINLVTVNSSDADVTGFTLILWLSKFHKSTGKWWRSISSKRSDCG